MMFPDVPVIKHFVNKLPPFYSSWQAWYDNMSEEGRTEVTFKSVRMFDIKEYSALFGELPEGVASPNVQVVYECDRDYLLARLAE